MSKGPVTISIADSISHVQLNRSEKLNALDATMFEALSSAAAKLNTVDSVRAVVLSGEGRSFCVGIDLSLLDGKTRTPFQTGTLAQLLFGCSGRHATFD